MAQQFATAAEAELACPVCFQFYVPPHDPKHFPNCAHICCRVCLKKLTAGRLKRTVKCPQCNNESGLPEDGIDALITALALRNLAEKHPEGIKQRKENMQDDLAKEKVETDRIVKKLHDMEKKMSQSIKNETLKVERLVEAIMTKAQELLSQIRGLNEPKLAEIRQQRTQLEAQIKTIDDTQNKLQIMSDHEFLTQTDTITNQISKLHVEEISADDFNEDHPVCTFVANAPQLGRLIKSRKLELVQEFGEFQRTLGIAATLSTDSLVVYDDEADSEQVTVFENKNGLYKKTSGFSVKHPRTCFDITTSPDGRILIPNVAAGIEVYSSDGKSQKLIKKNVEEGSQSITTMADGRILAGSGKDDEDGGIRPKVTLYDAKGHLIKTIPIGIIPVRIADVNGTRIVVSNPNNNKICVYDLETGKEALNVDIDMPLGVVYDEQSDCLLIARGTEKVGDGKMVVGSSVIEQYCSITGAFVARLAKGLCVPYSMTLTGEGMLAVADGKTLKLYRITYD